MRLLPPEDRAPDSQPHPDGAVIGKLEVKVATATPAQVATSIQIHLRGDPRPPSALVVSGKVAAAVELSPSLLVLPRESTEGPVYTARSLCRSTSGKPLALEALSAPPGVEVAIEGGEESASRTVRVTWQPQPDQAAPSSTRGVVWLHARVADSESVLELPILLRGAVK